MNFFSFSFCGAALRAMPSGALWFPDQALLCVSDLHLGKSERMARRSGQPAPPYDTRDTLTRLAGDIDASAPRIVVCLGDSFDDLTAAQSLPEEDALWIARLQAGRQWIWIEGNHDPGPVGYGGTHLREVHLGGLRFRHIASRDAKGEVSGHFHPKARVAVGGRTISRPAFLYDDARLILPAYGTYTGGLRTDDRVLGGLMGQNALAILTGPVPTCLPMPRREPQ